MRLAKHWNKVSAAAAVRPPGRRPRDPQDVRSEEGSAALEFITTGMILLGPLVYLIVAMAALQGGSLAVAGAARQAARVYVDSPDEAAANTRALRAVQFALADYGLDANAAEVSIYCPAPAGGCLKRQSAITVSVRIRVTLPLVPDVLSLPTSASIPIEATATQIVSRFWGTR
ncbi:hypothetical protein [Cryobacterium sp. CG_9.6]|uniref:hypothetical protein n=1 Tax=Cryobacterium sp. CG_9.6 TaxID=2760710 RepID=UPI002474CA3F|nr:hypothetical protein [Cryobacterium sp. CG_9.6]MDH6236246.1 Flp pilus assembly protein TadG [Cryobacterium sp. CG_9.6]